MPVVPATGTVLRSNEIMSTIRNMIISQQVFGDNIKRVSSLADKVRVEGSLYGDTKLYYSTDILESSPWNNDSEAANLLALDRPEDPKCQKIVLDQFRQIRVTLDSYMSKRAFSDEGTFTKFNSVMLGWINETKKVFDDKNVNVFYGTNTTAVGSQSQTVDLSSATTETANRMNAMKIGEKLANVLTDLTDPSRDYNDFGFVRSYDASDFRIVWNAKFYNKMRKVDLPTIFHNEGLQGDFKEMEILPAKYFGAVNAAGGTTAAANTTIRAAVEKDFGSAHLLPGDLLPNSTAYGANETYTVDETIVCKIVHKDSTPYMSSFSVQTVFVNPRSLTETNYLTFGFNTLEHLMDKPFITITANTSTK